MKNKTNKLLPLEFQKINKVKKNTHSQSIKQFIEVELHQTSRFRPNAFYKPISKIIKFEIL